MLPFPSNNNFHSNHVKRKLDQEVWRQRGSIGERHSKGRLFRSDLLRSVCLPGGRESKWRTGKNRSCEGSPGNMRGGGTRPSSMRDASEGSPPSQGSPQHCLELWARRTPCLRSLPPGGGVRRESGSQCEEKEGQAGGEDEAEKRSSGRDLERGR